MAQSTSIHFFPVTGSSTSPYVQHALALLRPHLPVALPLYRRLQFGRFFESTVLLTNLSDLSAQPPPNHQWLLAFIDRSVRPETELWIFGSWETGQNIDDHSQVQDDLLRNFARAIATLPLPTSVHQDVVDEKTNVKDHSGVSRAEYAGHLSNPKIVLAGAVHETTARMLERAGLVSPAEVRLVSNHMYIFDIERLPRMKETLPEGLRWGQLEYSQFELVRSRTQIPRQDKTLAILPQMAIFDGDVPIAWAFVGLDGALTTLHVEEAYRRQGLGKLLTRKLFSEKMDFLWEEDVKRMAHGYVIEGNEGSCAVCESLGGTRDWDVFWVRMDLSAVGGDR